MSSASCNAYCSKWDCAASLKKSSNSQHWKYNFYQNFAQRDGEACNSFAAHGVCQPLRVNKLSLQYPKSENISWQKVHSDILNSIWVLRRGHVSCFSCHSHSHRHSAFAMFILHCNMIIVGLDRTGHMSFLTGQDRTPKFARQVLPDRTESGLIFLNILYTMYGLSIFLR